MTDMRPERLERLSAAYTLSDLEMVVFPELMYGLVLANIMSRRIWAWRNLPWFRGMASMTPYRRILRVKQYVMDNYAFNLDLKTWGLTTKDRELARFQEILPAAVLKELSPFFGYARNRRYLDLDVRRHFGLQEHAPNTIPYWKTETVEAMDAFRHRPNHVKGAGECVSLAALYAAALFVVGRIPLSQIYLIMTPLHCQGFVDIGDGMLTNNRRVVTKRMWFNSTSLSTNARRALEDERITLVAHETGWVHVAFPGFTMDREAYRSFTGRLRSYLDVRSVDCALGSFLRRRNDLHKWFQVRVRLSGVDRYIGLDRIFEVERAGHCWLRKEMLRKLAAEIDPVHLRRNPAPGSTVLNDLEELVTNGAIDLGDRDSSRKLEAMLRHTNLDVCEVVNSLLRFARTEPRLPDLAAKMRGSRCAPLNINHAMNRAQIISRLEAIRSKNAVANTAFHTYRDLSRTEAGPFVRAAIERNPVSAEGARHVFGGPWKEGELPEALLRYVKGLTPVSIYPEAGRLAQPDEVWNFGRGDGVEKALLLANIFAAREPDNRMAIELFPDEAVLMTASGEYPFPSQKSLPRQTWSIPTPQRHDDCGVLQCP
jgi:hypothetical protein